MDNEKEFKIWLKRIEPVDLYEDKNEVRIAYIYSMKNSMNNYLTIERTINCDDNVIIDIGTFFTKFYGGKIILFYKNYKYEFGYNRGYLRKVKMYGDI